MCIRDRESVTNPSVDVSTFRTARVNGILGPKGIFERVHYYFVGQLPTDPHHLLPHMLGILELEITDDGVPTCTLKDESGEDRTYNGDDAIDVAWHRRMRPVHVLEILLHVNGIIRYDGTMKGGPDMVERWMQIVGCCAHMQRMMIQYNSLRVFQHRNLLAIATTSNKNPTFDMLRLDAYDPRRLNKYQRLLVKMLREAQQRGLRKYDGKLYRAKRVRRLIRARHPDGTLKCAHPGCPGESVHTCKSSTGEPIAAEAHKRCNHVFRPVLLDVEGDTRMYSTHAFVPIHEDDPTEGPSPYTSSDISHFVQCCSDRHDNQTAWLDMTSTQMNHRHCTDYLTHCIDDELPSLADKQSNMLLSFQNGAYDLKTDTFVPYWCSTRTDDPEACASCSAGGGPDVCQSMLFAQDTVAAAKYFDLWMDMAAINDSCRGPRDPSRCCAPEFQYSNYIYNEVCIRCHAPKHRHKITVCKRAHNSNYAVRDIRPRCVKCGTFGVRAHIGRRSTRPPPPCECWAPYRPDTSNDFMCIPTPYLDSILKYQRFTWTPATRTEPAKYDKQEEARVISWVYALLGRLKYPNDHSHDRWQVALMIVGTAATGKSTILELVQSLFKSDDVGIMQARAERDFGTSALVVQDRGKWRFRPLVVAPEMSASERGMDQATWQSIITGGPDDVGEGITVPIKNVTPPKVVPQCQVIMAGNERMRMSDPHGQFSRRVWELTFAHDVKARHKDALLRDRLLVEELPYIVVKANRAYRARFEDCGGHAGEVWGLSPFEDVHEGKRVPNLPEYFHAAKNRVSAEANIMKRFQEENKADLVFDPTAYITVDLFRQLFNTWCVAVNNGRRAKWESKTYELAFRQRGISIVEEERAWEPHTENMVMTKYLVGISLPVDKACAASTTGYGWFTQNPTSERVESEGPNRTRQDDSSIWTAALTNVVEHTTHAIDDRVWASLLDTHWDRGGRVSRTLTTLFCGKFHAGNTARAKQDAVDDLALFREYAERRADFEAWRTKEGASKPAKRLRPG